jgi:ferritin-like protein
MVAAMANSVGYHESESRLSDEAKDFHRAIVSLQEELEAVDWYNQRAEVCADPGLKAILQHNLREEIEHASMILEWLRRRSPTIDMHLKTYLFSSAPITEIEHEHDEDH